MTCSSIMQSKERVIKYEQKIFLKKALMQLGINPKNNGFILIQRAIIYAYIEDMITINLEDIYKYIATKEKISTKGIESIIRYSFYNINTKKLKANYERIFGIEFDFEYFSIRNIISDFIDLLDNI